MTYDVTFDTVGEKPNTAEATGQGKTIEVKADDKATVTVTTGDGGGDRPPYDPSGGGGSTPSTPSTPSTSIPNSDVPLTVMPAVPKDDVVIMEPDVPLADIPQTGTDSDMAVTLSMFGLSLTALLTVLFGRKKREQ